MQPISPLVAGDFLAPVQRMRQKFQIYVDGFWVDLTGYAPVPIPEPPAYNFDLVIQDMAHAHTIENVVWSGEYIYAESCEYDDVAAAIALASPGDIVVVPAGYATWTYRLVITKGILLIAAGIGATVITCGFTATEDYFSSGHYLVTYQPITPADDEPFRLSGFTLNCDGKCLPILLKNTTTSPLTKVRIDHNRAYNKLLLNGKTGHDLFVYGTVYGVADNNEMDYYRLYGLDAQSWNNLTFTPGGADNFYIEDGTITQHSDHVITYGEAGGRYCLRHSDIAITGGAFPLCDAHGNGPYTSHLGTMGIEIYENTVTGEAGCFFDQRGGIGMVFNNNWVVPSGSIFSKIREEYPDSDNPPAVNPISGQPQYLYRSYYWGNKRNGATVYADFPYISTTFDYNTSQPSRTPPFTAMAPFRVVPQMDLDCWSEVASFDGSGGVGVGTYAEMMAITPTTLGVGWCDNVNNRLYRAIAGTPMTWELYYEPYTYPHPLRSDPVLGD